MLQIAQSGASPAFSFIFTGNLEPARLREAYADANLVVLPSYSEGVPRVVIEAQAMKVPVIATDVGGTSEAMIDGVTGTLIKPGDIEQLALTIDKVFQI